MATAAVAAKKPEIKDFNFTWVGQDRGGKTVRGEMRATGEAQVNALLRRQGIKVQEIKRQKRKRGGTITEKDITLFTRQLATMLKSGVPLLQAFDIVAKGHGNPAVAKLIYDVRTEVETGSSLRQAFEKHPLHFEPLYCNLIGAGETAGILDTVLERLASYKEKILAIKSKIRAALFYPLAFYNSGLIPNHALPKMNEDGSIISLTYLGADRTVPGYRVMGTAKAALQHAEREQDRDRTEMRDQEIDESGFAVLLAVVVGRHQEIRRERHRFPRHHEEIGIVGEDDDGHAGERPRPPGVHRARPEPVLPGLHGRDLCRPRGAG